MIDRTQFAIGLGLLITLVVVLGLTFLVIFITATRADRMRSTRQRRKRQHWSIRAVARFQRSERRLFQALFRRRSRRR